MVNNKTLDDFKEKNILFSDAYKKTFKLVFIASIFNLFVMTLLNYFIFYRLNLDVDFLNLFMMIGYDSNNKFIISILVFIFTLVYVLGSFLIVLAQNKGNIKKILLGLRIQRMYYYLLLMIITIGIIVMFIGLAGPFFPVIFALIPMTFFGLLYAVMLFLIKQNIIFCYKFAGIKLITEFSFEKSLKLSAILIVIVGTFMAILEMVTKHGLINYDWSIWLSPKPYAASFSIYFYSMINTVVYFIIGRKY